MRIGLASDSFGNVPLLERALEHFRRAQVDRVFFLGGRLADLDAALARFRRVGSGLGGDDPLAGNVVRIPSRACPEYADPASRKGVDLVEGMICCLVHDKAELTRDDIENSSVLFHGNSSHAALVRIGPRCFVTPGHLRSPAPEGSPPTFALAEVTAREILLTVFSAECAELRQERASLAATGKMSVR